MKTYPKTKPSGVEWLGNVPEHWEVKRSDGLVSADKIQISPAAFAEKQVFHYSIPVVQETGTGQLEDGSSIASAKQVIRKPVILVAKLNPRKATICLAKPQGTLTLCSTEFVALNSNKCEIRFLEYLVQTEIFRQGLDSKVQSVTRSHQRANPADIYKFWNAWPLKSEQTAIAAYLDRETGRIDELVSKKRELIERLKEKRTALISRTVTRGLPAGTAKRHPQIAQLYAEELQKSQNSPPSKKTAAKLPENHSLKPSEIEWLGEVPEGWEVTPLGYLARLSGGATPDKSKPEYWDGSIPWVSPKDMKVALIDETEDHVSPKALENSALRMIPNGTVLIVVRGMILAHSFPVALTTAPVTINQDMKAVLTGKRLKPEFLRWSFDGFSKSFVSLADESAHGTRKFESSTLKRFPFLLPPLPEQIAIAAYLDAETSKLDALVAKVKTAIECLQEYRSALITAAVTGKIDVKAQQRTLLP